MSVGPSLGDWTGEGDGEGREGLKEFGNLSVSTGAPSPAPSHRAWTWGSVSAEKPECPRL